MSVRAVHWALHARAARPLRHMERLVLVALADYVDQDGVCWPAQSTIAEELDVNAGSVRRAVDALVKLGLVSKVERLRRGRGLGTWRYQLAVDNAVDYRAPARASDSDTYRAPARATNGRRSARNGESYRAPRSDVPRTSARAESLEPPIRTARITNGTTAYAPPLLTRCADCGQLDVNCRCGDGPPAPPPRRDLD